MNDYSSNNKRIAKNTVLLYFRMLLLLMVSLYTSRVILNALGVVDFGIYNVVGGVVSMFSLVSGALNVAITRFLTFELGKNNMKRLKEVFSTSLTIQLAMSVLILLLIETIGVWFLNEKMVIPHDRLLAANYVLQFSILTFCVNLLSVPYNAAIIAHEKMSAFAYISILEAVLRLLIAFLVISSPIDKLIYYALLMFASALLIRMVYVMYCKKFFVECSYTFIWNTSLLRQMFGFVGWTFVGVSSAVLRTQGGNILINLFCGPTANAARGIAVQAEHAVGHFAQNFMTALNPQITKSYAQGNKEYLMSLVIQGARFSFYLLLFLSLPILINTHYILELWLKVVPDYSVIFVQLILIFVMSEAISNPLVTLAAATGKIRNYQLLVGGLQSLNFPSSLFLLWWGMGAEIVFVVSIVLSQVCLVARLFILKRMVGFPPAMFIRKVYINIVLVCFCALVVPCLIKNFFSDSFLSFFILSCICCLCSFIAIYFVGLDANERHFVIHKCKSIIRK